MRGLFAFSPPPAPITLKQTPCLNGSRRWAIPYTTANTRPGQLAGGDYENGQIFKRLVLLVRRYNHDAWRDVIKRMGAVDWYCLHHWNIWCELVLQA